MSGPRFVATCEADFIGSRLEDQVAAQGFEVVVLDNGEIRHVDSTKSQIADTLIRLVEVVIRYHQTVRDSAGSASFRPLNACGPRQAGGDSVIVTPRFAGKLAKGISPLIYPHAERRRDFIYVDDVPLALLSAAECAGKGQVFNFGSKWVPSVNELFGLLQREFGGERIDAERAPAKAGNVADMKKAAESLPPSRISLEDGLKFTLHERTPYAG